MFKLNVESYTLNDGFTTILGTPFNIGIVTGFHEVNGFTYIEFNHSIVGLNINTLSSTLGQCTVLFLSFKKDCSANISSLLGYYAEATLVNDDFNNRNELFGVNSQVAISSK